MGDFTRVKSPMKIHGRFYLSKKTPDYKMTHQLFTLFWIISNILTFHFYTFSVICTFYFYIAFKELTFHQKCSIKCVLYSLFYPWNLLKQRDCGHEWTCYVDEDIDGCGADGKLLVGDRRRGHYQVEGGRKVGLVITETALSCLRANLQTDKCG